MGFGVPSLSYRLGVFALDKCKQKKKGCLAYSTDQDNKSSQIFITSLASNREERFQFKQTFGFSRPYSVAHEIDQSQWMYQTKVILNRLITFLKNSFVEFKQILQIWIKNLFFCEWCVSSLCVVNKLCLNLGRPTDFQSQCHIPIFFWSV